MVVTSLWTLEELTAATSGRLEFQPQTTEFNSIGFDSREATDGAIFLALKGVRDGHDFVANAFTSGAGIAITERQIAQFPCLIVPDVQKALEGIAVLARNRAPMALRGAVTGSVGKTSVTQMVMAGLKAKGHAHSAIKSFNNHIGVPLTLSRMPRETLRAIFEIGMNHADEITPLSQFVAPHVVMITTVGAVHTENFADGEAGIAKAKAEIFDGLAAAGLAILNADNRWFSYLSEAAKTKGATIVSFGEGEGATARLISHGLDGDRAAIIASIRGQEVAFSLAHTGKHQALNALGSILMLEALGVDIATAVAALEAFESLDGRGAIRELVFEGKAITVIDESYNANPISMAATLNAFVARPKPMATRKVVVMTDMLELGPDEAQLHAGLAEHIVETDIDQVYCAGPLMAHLWAALPDPLKGGYAETADKVLPILTSDLQAGDVVMIKGSNGSKAGLIAKSLTAKTN